MYSRRRLLSAGGVLAASGLAGCSARYAVRPKMDFGVENFRGETVDVGVRFMRPDVSERSEAIAYENSFEVPPAGELDDTWTVEDVVRDRPYRIETRVGPNDTAHHYHYRPDCADEDPFDIGVVLVLTEDGVRFQQTTCSDDSVVL